MRALPAEVRPEGRDRWRRWLPLAIALVALEVVYVYVVSAGKLVEWPGYTSFSDMLAEGFRSGHLYLAQAPPAALLAAKNPFDPVNINIWLWDASLYHNHYYLYWGPLPSLLLAAVKSLFRWTALPAIGDERCLFVAETVRLIVGALLIDRMSRRLFPGLPAALPLFATLVFACANPTPWMLGRAAVYETAIDSAQACIVAGLLFGFVAVERRAVQRSPRPMLAAASASWVLACACRITVAPAIALLALTTLLLARPRSERRWRVVLMDMVAIGAPLAAGTGALLAYNRARFGAWLDFGIWHQLTTIKVLTSWRYVWPNVYSYLLRPPRWSCHFPLVSAPWTMGPEAFPNGYALPEGYDVYEPLAGLLRLVPWAWFGLAAIPLIAVALWRRRRAAGALGLDDDARLRIWCLAAFLCAATVPLFPALPIFAGTMRYLDDIAAGVTLLGTLGAWSIYALARPHVILRRVVVTILVVVGLLTVVFGLLLGLQGYYEHFHDHNPRLWERMVRALSVCKPGAP